MPVYDPNAPVIDLPTKHGSPILEADRPVIEPYNRVQWPMIFPPGIMSRSKWRMIYNRPYIRETSGNLLWATDYAEADSIEGPWIPLHQINKDLESISGYYDTYVNKFRWVGVGGWGQSDNFIEIPKTTWTVGGGPTSVIRHQVLSSNSPFIAFVRGEEIINGKARRRAAIRESGDWQAWTNSTTLTEFNGSEFEQCYGLSMMSYKGKIVGLAQWIELDTSPSTNNQIGIVSNELVWCNPPSNATTLVGVTWNRTNRKFLDVTPNEFDAGSVLAGVPVVYDGTVYFPYTAFRQKHGMTTSTVPGGPGPGDAMISFASMDQETFDDIIGV